MQWLACWRRISCSCCDDDGDDYGDDDVDDGGDDDGDRVIVKVIEIAQPCSS